MSQTITIQEALLQMIETEKFKQAQRIEPSLRVYAQRIRRGEFRDGAAVEMLQAFGYKINVEGGVVADKAGK